MKTIKLLGTEREIAKGFYLLMTNVDTYSSVLHEFVVPDCSIELLKKNKIKFEVVK